MAKQLNKAQLDYVETTAIAIAVGLAAREGRSGETLADAAFRYAEAMLAEREKRYGELKADF